MDQLPNVGAEPPGALSMLLARLARGAPAVADAAWAVPLRPGDRLGRYEIVRELARGGFGAVYEARDRELGRAVAVKTVRPGRTLAAEGGALWLQQEAEAVGSLSHPGIVAVYDVGAEGGAPYVVMELLRGETLAARLERGPLDCDDALRIARDVAAALAYAHARGVLHRDLKPANVFLCEDGVTKLLDFGLSHVFGQDRRRGGGTPAYLAPERWRGDAEDARSDLFSLGVLLYEMLAGKVPYPVVEGRGAALEPGPPPRVPKRIPRRLAALLAAALAKDPAARPANADAVHAELVGVQRRLARHRWWLWSLRLAAVVLAAVAVGSGVLWRARDAAPPASGERLAISVADFANDTGERDLDGLSGLVITSLEQSKRLNVLTRSRMVDVLRQLGRADAPTIDEALAREIGLRTGAHAVLVGSIRRFGERYALELRGLHPDGDTYLFAIREDAKGRGAIPDALDRLSARAREALREGGGEVRASAIRLAESVTPNLEAYQHYFAGVDCMERPSRYPGHPQQCLAELRRAVTIDPQFALAWLQLATVGWDELLPATADRANAIAQALRYSSRLPPKERVLVRARAAAIEGRDAAALSLYREVTESFPHDKQALFLAGDLLWHLEERTEAIPYLERVLALDPTFDFALDHLSEAHAVLGHREALAAWRRRWEAMAPSPAVLRAIVRADLGLGEVAAAIKVARRAVAIGPETYALAGLGWALAYAGEYRELERVLRGRESLPFELRVLLAQALAAQGRRAAAHAQLERLAGPGASDEDRRDAHFFRAIHAAGDRDLDAVLAEAAEVAELDAEMAAKLAPYVARLGDLPRARELATGLTPGSPRHALYLAIVDWKEGRLDDARARLDALERAHPLAQYALAPAFVRAEVAAEAGLDTEALEALDRLDRLPFQPYWRSWTYPESLLLRARTLARLGRPVEARAVLVRLKSLWVNADAGLPLRDETRVLLSRVR